MNTECMICMDEMLPSSLVSWSSRKDGCGHAYHKDCIREWLLRHSECPYCRQVMLPIDEQYSEGMPPQRRNASTVQRLTTERIQRQNTTHYCQIHGVIAVAPKRDCCPDDDAMDHLEVTTMTMSTTSTAAVTTTTTTTTAPNSTSLQNHVTQILLGHHEDRLGVPTEPPLPCVDDKSRSRMIRLPRPIDDGVDHNHADTHSSRVIDVEAQGSPRVVGTAVNNHVEGAPDSQSHAEFGSYDVL
jgi:hypothetical protein